MPRKHDKDACKKKAKTDEDVVAAVERCVGKRIVRLLGPDSAPRARAACVRGGPIFFPLRSLPWPLHAQDSNPEQSELECSQSLEPKTPNGIGLLAYRSQHLG